MKNTQLVINKLQRLIDELEQKKPSFLHNTRIEQYQTAIDILKLYNYDVFEGDNLKDYIIFVKANVCKFFKITVGFVELKTRKREAVVARQIIMSIIHIISKKGLSYVGEKTFGQDHATVLHAKKTVRNLSATNKKYKEDLQTICTKLNIDFNKILKNL